MDFFTAIDDLQMREETGAGMMGTVEFNSACFYRYSVIDLDQLKKNLGDNEDLARKTIAAFVKASVAAIPTGKQNSMAAHNPPSFIMSIVKNKGQPMSLANAFARPVSVYGQTDKDLVGESISRLSKYFGNVIEMYGKEGISYIGFAMLGDPASKEIEEVGGIRAKSTDQLVISLEGALKE
jgi:CRISPR system Cascade subunit CasC